MKVKNIRNVGKRKVYDLSVDESDYNSQNYVLKNGVVSHNTGSYYASDNIWIVGRQQDKKDKELRGHHFIINIEKSRYVREKSKIPITISFEGGINKYSGLLEIAIEGGYVARPKVGWYARVNRDTGELLEPNLRAAQIETNKDFWTKVFNETDFAEYIKKTYSIAISNILEDDDFFEELENALE